MDKITYIYTLEHPITGEIRYIGKTNNLKRRLQQHLTNKRGVNHKNCWIASLLKDNIKPIMNILDEVPIEEWEFWEQHYISLYKSWGINLTNSTNGGDCITQTKEIKDKIAKALLGNKNGSANKGKAHSKETCDKISKILKDKKMTRIISDKQRKEHSEYMIGNTNWLGKKHSEESKLKMSLKKIGNQNSKGNKTIKLKIKQ